VTELLACGALLIAVALVGSTEDDPPSDSGATLYVAPDGDDGNPGTESSPVATLHRARDVVRTLKKSLSGPMTVLVRGGTYCLSDTLVFGPEDSGTDAQPITYAAYRGEKPTISGGMQLKPEWKPYRDGIMKCAVPAGMSFTQLFVNGQRRIRARYPNFDPERPLMGDSGYINATGGGDGEFYFDPETFTRKKWRRPTEAIVHIFPSGYWNNAQYRVKAVDWDRCAVILGEGGWQTHEYLAPNHFDENSRFFIDNVFEELDAPDEWYLDEESGILYFKPPEGLDLATATVEVTQRKRLMELKGSRQQPVTHIRLVGFRFTQTETTYMDEYEVPSTGDWGIHRGGAIFLEGTEDCAVEDCFFDAVGGNAVFVSNHNRRVRIYGNTFTHSGDSAVCLCGKNNMVEAEWQCEFCGAERPWTFTDVEDYPADCLVTNNLIHHIGEYGKQVAGVFISISRDNTISHNHIHDMPRTAICINDPFWGGHVVEYNDIHNTVLETDDHGGFNAWGRGHYWCLALNDIAASHEAGDVKRDARFPTIIRYNRFRDQDNYGIVMDDGASNFHVYNNLCLGVGVQNRNGEYRIIENNVFVNPCQAIGYEVGHENNHDQFLRNIVVVNADLGGVPDGERSLGFRDQNAGGGGDHVYRVGYPPKQGQWVDEIDYNVLFNYAGEFSVDFVPRNGEPETLSWEQWRELGFDKHSVRTDPMFLDPANGDYRVAPSSPALKLGFRNFDTSRFGLLPDFPRDRWR